MGEYTVCHLKCFKCGSELTDSEKGIYWWAKRFLLI
jgi:hypothetical protein